MNNKEQLSLICKKLYEKGLSPGFSGNVSVSDGESILVSPSGFSLNDITPEIVVRIDFNGNVLEGGLNPTSEKFMHIKIYQKRPDINAIIHCHAPKSSAFAVAGMSFSEPILAENILLFGDIPLIKYSTPSSLELAEDVSEAFVEHNAALMQNHGVIVGGKDLNDVFYKMDTVEYCSEVYINAKMLGNICHLSEDNIKDIIALRKTDIKLFLKYN